MIVSELLNSASSWAYRLVERFKSREKLIDAIDRLSQLLLEKEAARSAEVHRALKLEMDLKSQRERLARDLHDCVGSQLTHIIGKLDLIRGNSSEDSVELLRLQGFVRDINQSLRETIWALDQEAVTTQAFGARIHGMLQRIWEGRERPKLNWVYSAADDQQFLPACMVLQVVRIVQEATNNALKYAEAGNLYVGLYIGRGVVRLEVNDDGVGFNTAAAHNGYGISNMQKRVESLSGDFSLRSSDLGTFLAVRVPFQQD